MAHDVFISHAKQDKAIADAACATLEQAGIRCWIAPRDIQPGADWGESLMLGLRTSRVLVLVLSSSANSSPHIRREVERAVHQGIPVVPMRVEDVMPEGALEYHLGTVHWLDAMTPPLETHLKRLAGILLSILARDGLPTEKDVSRSPRPAKESTESPRPPVPAAVKVSAPTAPPPPVEAPPEPPLPPPLPRVGSLSEMARLVNVFIAPRKTFTDLRRNPSWWAPVLLMAIIDIVWVQVLKGKSSSAFANTSVRVFPGVNLTGYFIYAYPLIDLIYWLLVAVVCFGAFKKIGRATDLTFKGTLAVVVYAALPLTLGGILWILSIPGFLPNLSLGADYFLHGAPTWAYRLAFQFNILAIWSLILRGIGLSYVSTLKRSNALLGVFGLQILYSLLDAFIP